MMHFMIGDVVTLPEHIYPLPEDDGLILPPTVMFSYPLKAEDPDFPGGIVEAAWAIMEGEGAQRSKVQRTQKFRVSEVTLDPKESFDTYAHRLRNLGHRALEEDAQRLARFQAALDKAKRILSGEE